MTSTRMRGRSFRLPCIAGALTLAVAPLARAQDLPAGTMKHGAASSGSTEVAQGDQFEAAPTKADPKTAKDATEAQIQAGGMQATGNARSLAATASAQIRVRRETNQFSSLAAANYARAAVPPDKTQDTTVENVQGKVRYDRFLTERLAVFLSTSARRDRFQGLNLRLNVDPGVAYYFVDEPSHQFWGELGYDLQLDLRRQDTLDAAAAAGEPLDDSKVRHSGRAFVGYQNTLNAGVAFTTGVEYIQGIMETEAWRLNWDVGLTSKIGGKFSLATTFSLKYDHAPLPGIEELDTMTALNLVYQLI